MTAQNVIAALRAGWNPVAKVLMEHGALDSVSFEFFLTLRADEFYYILPYMKKHGPLIAPLHAVSSLWNTGRSYIITELISTDWISAAEILECIDLNTINPALYRFLLGSCPITYRYEHLLRNIFRVTWNSPMYKVLILGSCFRTRDLGFIPRLVLHLDLCLTPELKEFLIEISQGHGPSIQKLCDSYLHV